MVNMKKLDLSEKINSLLGLDPAIDFCKLKMTDLQRLYDAVSKIPNLVQTSARATVERVMQGPVVSAARDLLNMPSAGLFKEMREQGGIIGAIERRAKIRGKQSEVKVIEPDKTA